MVGSQQMFPSPPLPLSLQTAEDVMSLVWEEAAQGWGSLGERTISPDFPARLPY